ncbi:hypothetical protein ACFP2F_16255 [Hymenobacter artigasi]|uniref:Lipocalin-like domain-containing protein n=1 Tax=Hymenobacter artigasi TaxID=2719616 RepID=A0ABX1HP32_9BACT|nr:hypothetical protein [Hymenobacter artigasi]NKI91664.1 hypothetical protein [Hymenobacter artigasi]
MHHSIHTLATALLLSLAGLSACSKDTATPTTASTPEQLLVGQWQQTTSTNGMTGRTSPADPAQRLKLVFTAAGQLTMLLNGTVVNTTPYSLVKRQSMLTQQLETYLVTDPGNTQVLQTVRVDANTLVLAIDAYDGPSATYQRRILGSNSLYW